MPVDQVSERTRVVVVVGFVAFLVLIFVWWIGPAMFAGAGGPAERVVTATVTVPAECTGRAPVETVRFSAGGDKRDATLHACGHDRGEKLEVAVPVEAGSGPITVRAAGTEKGNHDLRKPVGLALVALSCAGGAIYAFLVTHRSNRHGRRTVRAV